MLSDRFKSMYRQLGLDRAAAAQLLRVSERTLHNWETGVHEIPYSAYKLLRLLSYSEMPGKAWEGWHFAAGRLWSPEGYGFRPEDSQWWSALCRRSALFHVLYADNQRLKALATSDQEKAGARQSRWTERSDGLAAAAGNRPQSSEVLVTLHQKLTDEPKPSKAGDLAEGPKGEVMPVTPHQNLDFEENSFKTSGLPCPAQVRYKGIKTLFTHKGYPFSSTK